MVIRSTFYDTAPGEGVKETSWAESAQSRGPSYGVVGAGDLRLTAHPTTPYAVNLSLGKFWGSGVWDESTETKIVQCPTPARDVIRWDLIAARRDWQPTGGGPTSFIAIPGASSKAIPNERENRPGVVDDQPLWLVKWRGGRTQPEEIIDLRCWASNGGVEIADRLALDYLATPGAAVKLGRDTWHYELRGNGVWGWGRAGRFTQSANVSVATNNAGDGYFTFPEAFPNRLESLVVTDSSSPVSWGPMIMKWAPQYSSTTRGCVRVYGMDGRALPNRSGIWLSYSATGS